MALIKLLAVSIRDIKKFDWDTFITDEMPHNFYFIPLICAAFPEAKIIHVKRNAPATCWSNYKQYFTSNSLGYCYDLQDIVKYYYLVQVDEALAVKIQ